MASTNFKAMEQIMRRQYWLELVEAQLEAARRENFRASIVGDTRVVTSVAVATIQARQRAAD